MTALPTFQDVSNKFSSIGFNSIAQDLEALVRRGQDNDLSHLPFADLLAHHELEKREQRRVRSQTKRAGFPATKRLEEFDFRHQTTITKRQVQALLDFAWIERRHNLVLIGPPGTGKTHLAIALAHKAIEAGHKALFRTAQQTVETLDLAARKGELKRAIAGLLRHDLVVVDELGYLPMDKASMYNLFQFVNAAYEQRSLLLTTNKDFTQWGEFFHHDNVAIPVVDRVIHHSQILLMGGESYRLKDKLNGAATPP